MSLLCCPHCEGTQGVEFNDYGQYLKYSLTFSGQREFIDMFSYTPAPVFGKCIDCGKRIRLSKIEIITT